MSTLDRARPGLPKLLPMLHYRASGASRGANATVNDKASGKRSIASSLMSGTAVTALLCFGLTALMIYRQASSSLINASSRSLASEALSEARQIEIDLGRALATNDAMVATVSAQRGRGELLARPSMAAILEAHPECTGRGTLWEPNAYDGNDAAFKGRHAHDSTGQFMSYWAWHDGKPMQAPLTGYASFGDGDWYQVPRRDHLATITEPYSYDIAGDKVLMSTLSTPIIEKGKFLGVFLVDFSLAGLQKHLATLKPLGSGNVELLSPKGIVLASADRSEIGQRRSDAVIQRMLGSISSDRPLETFTPDAKGKVRL